MATLETIMQTINGVWPQAKLDMLDPDGIWRAAFEGIPEHSIRLGVRELARSTEKYPPKPGDAALLCRRLLREENGKAAQWKWTGFTTYDDWEAALFGDDWGLRQQARMGLDWRGMLKRYEAEGTITTWPRQPSQVIREYDADPAHKAA